MPELESEKLPMKLKASTLIRKVYFEGSAADEVLHSTAERHVEIGLELLEPALRRYARDMSQIIAIQRSFHFMYSGAITILFACQVQNLLSAYAPSWQRDILRDETAVNRVRHFEHHALVVDYLHD
jgi:hypothetical protein